MTNKLTYVLATIFAALLINVSHVFMSENRLDVPTGRNNSLNKASQLESIDFQLAENNSPTAYVNIIQQTLFSPERKFIQPEIKTTASDTSKAKQEDIATLKLKGIYINRDKKIALINSDKKKTNNHFKMGDAIKGWELVAIEKDSVLLKNQDGEETSLLLHPKKEQKQQKTKK